MKKKRHLTREQRCQISALLQAGHSQKEIAEVIGKDKSVISRELKRNGGKRGYSARLAQEKAQERKERYGRPRKFTVAMREEVERWLRQEQYSPEQIVGMARREGRPMVSHERIYQHIRADKARDGDLYRQLRHRLKHRRRPMGGWTPLKDRVSIEERPRVVSERSRFGDWEIDTIVGKEGRGAIVTLVERTTGFLLMEKLPGGRRPKAWPMWSLSCCCPTRIGCTRLPPTTGASSSVTGASPGGCRRGSISPIPMRPGSGA